MYFSNYLQHEEFDIDSIFNDLSSVAFTQVGCRQAAWFGNRPYVYSTHSHTSNAMFPPSINALLTMINSTFSCSFNCVLVNYYPSGSSSVGWHGDNEPEIDQSHPIASVSIGATRLFEVRAASFDYQYTIPLTHGMILFMTGQFQSQFKHRVPASNISEPRINLTFRRSL